MRPSTLLALATARSALSNFIAERAGCNANNRLRGTAPAFMKVTVTPAPTTSTYTVTVTSTLPFNKRDLAPRQVTITLSSVPAYATYCQDASAYSSACSCVGITAYTSTAPTPTVTTYTTITLDVCPAAGETSCGGIESSSSVHLVTPAATALAFLISPSSNVPIQQRVTPLQLVAVVAAIAILIRTVKDIVWAVGLVRLATVAARIQIVQACCAWILVVAKPVILPLETFATHRQ